MVNIPILFVNYKKVIKKFFSLSSSSSLHLSRRQPLVLQSTYSYTSKKTPTAYTRTEKKKHTRLSDTSYLFFFLIFDFIKPTKTFRLFFLTIEIILLFLHISPTHLRSLPFSSFISKRF